MNITNLEDLINKINIDLGDFCNTFRYKRKELAQLGKASSNRLFKYDENHSNWAINEGGGTEIQYHISTDDDIIRYGIGINVQYVPYNNDKSTIEYAQPFALSLSLLKKRNDICIQKLTNKGFELIDKEWNDLNNLTDGEFYLFGKVIEYNHGKIADSDYNDMIDCLKNELFDLYVSVWETKNRFTETIIKNMLNMTEYIDLLNSNHNIILTGAPGTGKTYLAKQIAQQMIFGETKKEMTKEEEDQFNERCGFVQFHPSYDYTDFVEGLRPIQDEDGNVGFKRRNGIFKDFCEKAVESTFTGGCDNFDEIWEKLISYIDEHIYIDIPLLTGTRNIRLELNSYGTGLTERLYSNDSSDGMGEKIRGHSKFFTKEQLYNIYRGLKGVPSGGHDNYRKAIVEYLKKEMGLNDYSAGHENKKGENYVFIIDEINRGEISKIFGELFFSIDPGYRGIDGKVKTQYQNLVEQGDVFYDGFYVPKNVYIIGTMNDIDRSVESMDFAFRRRFAFKEIKATDRVEMLYDTKNGLGNNAKTAEEKMNALNAEIEKIEGLSAAYHIGPAYFLKLNNYNGNFEQLWENHLKGLLFEYMRGMQKEQVEENMKKLKDAYDLKTTSNEQSTDNNNGQ